MDNFRRPSTELASTALEEPRSSHNLQLRYKFTMRSTQGNRSLRGTGQSTGLHGRNQQSRRIIGGRCNAPPRSISGRLPQQPQQPKQTPQQLKQTQRTQRTQQPEQTQQLKQMQHTQQAQQPRQDRQPGQLVGNALLSLPSDVERDSEQLKQLVLDQHRAEMLHNSTSVITADKILFVGLLYAGFEEARQNVRHTKNVKQFLEHYGTTSEAAAACFRDLKAKHHNVGIKLYLMSLNWLKNDDTERVLSGRWRCGERYIRDNNKDYVKKIASLGEDKICFGGFNKDEIILLAVNCCNFIVNEFRLDPSAKHYDHKSNSCGLKYELAMALRRPRIVSIRGPFHPSEHTITIFRGGDAEQPLEEWDQDALYFLMHKLGPDKRGVGDSGYLGEPGKIIVTKEGQTAELKQFLARAKMREETVHTRLKSWRILSNRFRHGKGTEARMALHGDCLRAVAVLTQYDFENGRPPFQVM